MNLPRFPGWTLVAAVATATLAACPVPLVPRYATESRHNVGERIPEFIVEGTTTRDDVLLQLGEPDGRGPGDGWFAYGSRYSEGGVIFILVGPGGGGMAASVEAMRYRRIVVRFDDQGIVQSAGFIERVCPGYMLGAGSGESKSAPCIDIAIDDVVEPAGPAEPGVPVGEQLIAVFAQVRCLGEFGPSGNPLDLPITGTLTLTDRSLVFDNRSASAGAPVRIVRIPYAEVVQASTSRTVVGIELSRGGTIAFDVMQAGSFAPGSPDGTAGALGSGTPAQSVVAVIRARTVPP